LRSTAYSVSNASAAFVHEGIDPQAGGRVPSVEQEKFARAMDTGYEIVARNFCKMTRDEFATEATLAFSSVNVARTTELSHRERRRRRCGPAPPRRIPC
jgi:hypothetical protein